ncbi:CheR family methyltransferase [Planctomycetota bacterium]
MADRKPVSHAAVVSETHRLIGEALATHLNTPASVRFFQHVATLVESRMRALGDTEEAYRHRFFQQPPSMATSEAAELARFVIPKVTQFFRYPEQFDALGSVLAGMCKRPKQQLHIWSAGCATGEEPYSIAMVAMETVPESRCRIVGTDIDGEALRTATVAQYGEAAVKELQQPRLQRWTRPGRAGERVIAEEVRSRVRFHRHSLADMPCSRPPGGGDWDVIFCRNVLMYLTESVQRQAAREILRALRPGGVLFLGPAEGLLVHGVDESSALVSLERHGDSLYYRKLETSFSNSAERLRGEQPSARAPWAERADRRSSGGFAERLGVGRPLPREARTELEDPRPSVRSAEPARIDREEGPPEGATKPGNSPNSAEQVRNNPGLQAERPTQPQEQSSTPSADQSRNNLGLSLERPTRLEKARLERAVTLADREVWDEALGAVREILVHSPRNAEAQLLLGVILARCGGDEGEAENALSRAVALGHESALAYFELGRLREQRAPGSARHAFAEALRVASEQTGDTLISRGLSVTGSDLVAACRAKLRALAFR